MLLVYLFLLATLLYVARYLAEAHAVVVSTILAVSVDALTFPHWTSLPLIIECSSISV